MTGDATLWEPTNHSELMSFVWSKAHSRPDTNIADHSAGSKMSNMLVFHRKSAVQTNMTMECSIYVGIQNFNTLADLRIPTDDINQLRKLGSRSINSKNIDMRIPTKLKEKLCSNFKRHASDKFTWGLKHDNVNKSFNGIKCGR